MKAVAYLVTIQLEFRCCACNKTAVSKKTVNLPKIDDALPIGWDMDVIPGARTKYYFCPVCKAQWLIPWREEEAAWKSRRREMIDKQFSFIATLFGHTSIDRWELKNPRPRRPWSTL